MDTSKEESLPTAIGRPKLGEVQNGEQSPFYTATPKLATKKSSRRSTSKTPLRRSKRKKRAPTKSSIRELALYDGQICLGVVKLGAKATAYDLDGLRIGTYATLEDATAALDKLRVRP